MLEKLLELLHNIQRSSKGSIGAWHNVYLPQLDRTLVDELEQELQAHLTPRAADGFDSESTGSIAGDIGYNHRDG